MVGTPLELGCGIIGKKIRSRITIHGKYVCMYLSDDRGNTLSFIQNQPD